MTTTTVTTNASSATAAPPKIHAAHLRPRLIGTLPATYAHRSPGSSRPPGGHHFAPTAHRVLHARASCARLDKLKHVPPLRAGRSPISGLVEDLPAIARGPRPPLIG